MHSPCFAVLDQRSAASPDMTLPGVHPLNACCTYVQEPVMTPAVATSLQGHHVTQLRGGQHHTLALTQVCLQPSCAFLV